MHTRRILRDDVLGLVEPLNEIDNSTGHGIRVSARYYMQIFKWNSGFSK